ncbi:DNA sulfur modification protein DndB [Cytobacillus horneckiae]|uniref:DNA sulfur modification protein DndB n=1 Tax=Cytobacillus horneckiae TaxID=549687 RepID=UPI0019CF64A1|nr:DNA sulfur modification protein DndB [Cytobacillus horneckiae]MBN6886104.1 hypothetical protein [Cytobacillus horneckiae]MCM3176405.1 hypothetical protein [Cytobacillus horneckiae]
MTSQTNNHRIVIYSIVELIKMIQDEKVEMRDTSQLHVRKIKKYLFDNATSKEIYLPPLVATTDKNQFARTKPIKLLIIDGSHRLKAFSQLETEINRAMNSEIKAEMKKAYDLHYMLEDTKIAVHLYEGFSKEEADQLYIDMNTKGKQVALSKRIEYDSRNILNQITNRVIISNNVLKAAGIETERRTIIRPTNKKFLSLSQLRRIIYVFIAEKTELSKEKNVETVLQVEEYIELINLWLNELFNMVDPYEIGNFNKSMLANFPLVMALGLYTNNGCKHKNFFTRKTIIKERMDALKDVDWSKRNPLWQTFNGSLKGRDQFFYLNKDLETIQQIVKWMESQGGDVYRR